MEILTSAEIEGKTITLDQTFTLGENKFITIKEIFSFDEEVYIAYINERIPFSYKIIDTEHIIERKRIIMSAKHFVLLNFNIFE